MAGTPLTTKNGAVFVQEDGPNTDLLYVGCIDIDTLTEPGGGINELRRCFKTDGTGWVTLASTRSPLDPVTTTVTLQVTGQQDAFARMREANKFGSVIIQARDKGVANDPGNYAEAYVLEKALVGERSVTSIVMREDEQFGEKSYALAALPPYYEVIQKTTARQSSAEALAFNGIHVYGTGKDLNKLGWAVADAVGSGTANVYRTRNAGATWTVTAADPGGSDEHLLAVLAFEFGADSERVIAFRGVTDAAAPPECWYSDDNGATWTSVSLGSTNALFVQKPQGVFKLDAYNIWATTDGGYIYYTNTQGATWTEQDAAAATAEDYQCIHFATESVGFAGATNGVVVKTEDGGDSWTAVTAITGTPTVAAVHCFDADNVWAATANGKFYYSTDGGTTWTERTFPGSNDGAVVDMRFTSLSQGWAIHSPASGQDYIYYTKDGGRTWEQQTTQANSGLNQIFPVTHNTAFYCGEAHGSLGYLGKAFPVT